MSASSLIVVANSLRLRHYHPGGRKQPASARPAGYDRRDRPLLAEASR
jgi:hypothetical protein